MQVNSLESILSSMESQSANKTSASQSSFTDLFSDALNNLKETESEATQANQALLTGESDDIHTAMIAAQKAEVAVSLAVQIRNKVIDAYNQIMGMQV